MEIWIFEKYLLNFLAKNSLGVNFLDLIKCLDLPNEKNQRYGNKEEIEKWHQYKMRLYESTMQQNYWAKKKKKDSYFI